MSRNSGDVAGKVGELYLRVKSLESRLRDARIEGEKLSKNLKTIVEVLESRNEYGPQIDHVGIDGFSIVFRSRDGSAKPGLISIPDNIRDVIKEIYDLQEALKDSRAELEAAEDRAQNT